MVSNQESDRYTEKQKFDHLFDHSIRIERAVAQLSAAIDDIVVARVLHILAVVHWIGGVALVTTGILPAVARLSDPPRQIEIFEAIDSGENPPTQRFLVALAAYGTASASKM